MTIATINLPFLLATKPTQARAKRARKRSFIFNCSFFNLLVQLIDHKIL